MRHETKWKFVFFFMHCISEFAIKSTLMPLHAFCLPVFLAIHFSVNSPINVRSSENAESVKALMIFHMDRLPQMYPLRKVKAMNVLVILKITFLWLWNQSIIIVLQNCARRQRGCKCSFYRESMSAGCL